MTFQINVTEKKNKNTPKKEFGRKTKEKGKEKQKKRHEENIMGGKNHILSEKIEAII